MGSAYRPGEDKALDDNSEWREALEALHEAICGPGWTRRSIEDTDITQAARERTERARANDAAHDERH